MPVNRFKMRQIEGAGDGRHAQFCETEMRDGIFRPREISVIHDAERIDEHPCLRIAVGITHARLPARAFSARTMAFTASSYDIRPSITAC